MGTTVAMDDGPGETNPYQGMSPGHEELIRRLHKEGKHPDYEYMTLTTELKVDLTQNEYLCTNYDLVPIMDAESRWATNEDRQTGVYESTVGDTLKIRYHFHYRREKRK